MIPMALSLEKVRLTIETVSRTFSKLKAMGIIEIDQGTTIRITAMDQLNALADGGNG